MRHKPSNPLRSADWLVRPIDPMLGRALIARYHYAGGTSNTATGCYGLVNRDTRAVNGVAWWIPPTRGAAEACLRGNTELDAQDISANHEWRNVLSLSRLVILPGLPTNAASFLMMRSAALLDRRWTVLATWADTERGHTGGIYKASGGSRWDCLSRPMSGSMLTVAVWLARPDRIPVRTTRCETWGTSSSATSRSIGSDWCAAASRLSCSHRNSIFSGPSHDPAAHGSPICEPQRPPGERRISGHSRRGRAAHRRTSRATDTLRRAVRAALRDHRRPRTAQYE